jgi:hypothetical protein
MSKSPNEIAFVSKNLMKLSEVVKEKARDA